MPSSVRWSRTDVERLLGEEERLEAQRRLLADQGQRVGQGEDDEVVLLVGVAQECTAVVDVGADTRVVVGPVRVAGLADLEQLWVDLDGVDMTRAVVQRQRDVRAAARSDDEHLGIGPVGEPAVDLLVELLDALLPDRMQRLVGDAVDRDVNQAFARREGADAVVGRPDVVRVSCGLLEDEHDHCDQRTDIDEGEPRPAATAEFESDHQPDGNREPDQRIRAQSGQQAERGDAGERADDVDGVRLEWRHALEQRTEWQGQGRQQRSDEADDERQDQEVLVRRSILRKAEEQLVLGVDLHIELEVEDVEHDQRQQHSERRQPRVKALAPEDDAQADAQEARNQQEVAEEADVLDVGRDPTDEHQLDEQNRQAGQKKASFIAAKKGEHGPRRLANYGANGRGGADAPETGSYQAVAVAASAMPCDSSQRSASMAALQPSAAAVMAWR